MTLRDPDVCRCGADDSHVLERRRRQGFVSRRHECRSCGFRWTTYESRINPRKLRLMPVFTGPTTLQVVRSSK